MTKDEIKEYLRENLNIQVYTESTYEDGCSGIKIKVTLELEGEDIAVSTDYCSL